MEPQRKLLFNLFFKSRLLLEKSFKNWHYPMRKLWNRSELWPKWGPFSTNQNTYKIVRPAIYFLISYFAGTLRNTPWNTKHSPYTFRISCEFCVLLMPRKNKPWIRWLFARMPTLARNAKSEKRAAKCAKIDAKYPTIHFSFFAIVFTYFAISV